MRWFERDEPEPAGVPEPSGALVPPPRRPPTAVGAREDEPQPQHPPRWPWHWPTLFARLYMAIEGLPPIPRYMAGGAVGVWGVWVVLITRSALLFPILLVLLLLASATPIADLILVGGSCLVATGCGALAGLGSEWVVRRRPQPIVWRTYANLIGLLSYAPVIILIALLARAAHGAILLAATLGILLLRRRLSRWIRKARAKRGFATIRQ